MQDQVKLSRGRSTDDDCVPLDAHALHDLLGPVHQMRSMADLIVRRYRGSLDDEAEALFGFLQDSSDRLQKLLSGLRTYTQIVGQHQAYRHFDANLILAGALATNQQQIDQNNASVSHDSLPELYGDPNQIEYIFAGLIENAIKFRAECRPQIHVAAAPEEDDWLLSVRDNGIGIDPRHSDCIFGVFRRVHNEAYPGAGMGLAIADRIIERHGGRIWVESCLGQGATFYFRLPRTVDRPSPSYQAHR